MRTFAFGADDARAGAADVLADMLAGVDPVQRERDVEAAAAVEQAAIMDQGAQHYASAGHG